jgi:hypothetical protein
MYICLCFSFLWQVLTRRGRDTTVSWKIERPAYQAGEEHPHILDSAVAEYGARSVQTRATGVGCVESPEWSIPREQTERPPLEGPMRRRDDLR